MYQSETNEAFRHLEKIAPGTVAHARHRKGMREAEAAEVAK